MHGEFHCEQKHALSMSVDSDGQVRQELKAGVEHVKHDVWHDMPIIKLAVLYRSSV